MSPKVSPVPPGALAGGRSLAIDLLRGFAILWVLAFHSWVDVQFGQHPRDYPVDTFPRLATAITNADLTSIPTAFMHAFLSAGNLGVPLFMMLSGLSLALSAERRHHSAVATARDIPRRFRKILIPYWAALAWAIAFYATVALVQSWRHPETSFTEWFTRGAVFVDWGRVVAGVFVVPRILVDSWRYAPMGALWFVAVLLQYYLLFPAVLATVRRVGPSIAIAGAAAIQMSCLLAYNVAGGDLRDALPSVQMLAPFRAFEFVLGVAVGYIIATRPSLFTSLRSQSLAAALACGLGAAAFVAGCLQPASIFSPALIIGGMTLTAAPLLAGPPPCPRSLPVRALAAAGVVSYGMLIVNDPLRVVTEYVTAEAGVGAATLWLAAICFPVTFVLARPVSIALGLVEKSSSKAPIEPPASATSLSTPTAAAPH